MQPVLSFHVDPALPERLRPIEELAYNLRWSWDHETIGLFRRLDRDLWEACAHNPVRMLGNVSQQRLREAANDEAFLAQLDRIHASLREYMTGAGSWYAKRFGRAEKPLVAYFSMEFGITECLPIYSGGLGVLAGDHLKSASDLGLPLVGVGLLYQKGYFHQYLTQEGWQQERYPVNDFSTMPIRPCRNGGREAATIRVELAGKEVQARLWRAQVGRVPLILLDTNIPANPPELQDVTDELYGGDLENRLRQEILLGIGGLRALDALGLRARVYHMNEGHCSFLGLERIRMKMRDAGLTFDEAKELVGASSVFTTHTPVPAGTDVFDAAMIERYFGSYREELGLDARGFLDLGRDPRTKDHDALNMTVLALRTAELNNGVSRLHGEVARTMWRDVWPGVPLHELPITHVTNGIHPGSWISRDLRELYDRYLGPRWSEEPGDTGVWQRAEQIPAQELWRTHERRRERLVAFARRRLSTQLQQRGAGKAAQHEAEEALDPKILTVGFARRFATYKRATLLLRDRDRLDRIVNHPERPVQILFAGKAHPQDDEGKKLIREIVQTAQLPQFRRRIVFLEDYDAVTTRYMVQGVDVWLNTPRRPLEASGTSGMKAAFNGVLNLSILDGWWDEAYSPQAGWAIGRGEQYADLDYQDRVEAGSLYDLLEREVAPLYYERGRDSVPRGWVSMMKSTMGQLCPRFNTNRMVHAYVTEGYKVAEERRGVFEEEDYRRCREIAVWRRRAREAWSGVRVLGVEADRPDELRVGTEFEVRARVAPGGLSPQDLVVQVYLGTLDENREIVRPVLVPMTFDREVPDQGLLYRGPVVCRDGGTVGFTVRVLPVHPDLGEARPGELIAWASAAG